MQRTLVLNVVGLSAELLGDDTPNLRSLARRGAAVPLRTLVPAVTCSVQASMTTGTLPREHGIVGNGWYFRELSEVSFWRQSNRLVEGRHVWDDARARDSRFTCAKLFWWFNMYARVDFSVTPRPMYPADGRKLPDVYAEPAELRTELQRELGQFPLFRFWGPATDLSSSEWIARCAHRVIRERNPTLTLVYLPHLDYDLQRFGPHDPRIRGELRAIDAVCGELLDLADRERMRVIVLSEYGIVPVDGAVDINRVLRKAGLLRVREELGRELLDAGASEAFAVADHQVAHVYLRDAGRSAEVAALLRAVPGVERVLDASDKRDVGLDHPRSGELVAIAAADRWFTYYYWLDDARAPDFARCVDIHRKPGYDPVELFLDPALRVPQLSVGWRVARNKLGIRGLMDVIPLRPDLVRGSHGRVTDRVEQGPVLITNAPDLLPSTDLHVTDVKALLLRHLCD